MRVPQLGLLLLSALAGCATTSIDYVTGRPTLNDYTLDQDITLGTKLATMIIASSESLGAHTDPEEVYTRTLWRVADRLLGTPENRARMPPLPWEVHAISDRFGGNAWCFPGGQVLALTGLLQSGVVRDEDELAAVLGHEMAHAAARHATERATVADLEDRLPFGRFFTDRMVDFVQPDTPRALWQGFQGQAISYSVLQETEADIIGLEMMARAGYAPSKAPAIWKRISDRVQSESDKGTHPPFAAREKVLLEHLSTAAYVASRLPLRPPPERLWVFDPTVMEIPSSTVSIASLDPLPEGPRLRSVAYPSPREVLDASLRIYAGPSGEALRAEALVRPSRDLREDRLPFSATLKILRIEPTRSLELWVQGLAKNAPLDRPLVPIRVALAPLPPGHYEARLRIVVGSVERWVRHRFDIAVAVSAGP